MRACRYTVLIAFFFIIKRLTQFQGRAAVNGASLYSRTVCDAKSKKDFSMFWLVRLDRSKRKQVLEVVQTNVEVVYTRCSPTLGLSSVRRIAVLLDLVCDRMLWSNGNGLVSCLLFDGSVRVGFSAPYVLSAAEQTLLHLLVSVCVQVFICYSIYFIFSILFYNI